MSAEAGQDWDEWEMFESCNPGVASISPKQLRLGSESGVGPWEISIFEAIWYDFGQVRTKEMLANRAFGTYLLRNPAKGWAALENCFNKGFVQFLTKDFLDRMQQELVDGKYLIPNGLVGQGYSPKDAVGLISFTERGASFNLRWAGFDPSAPNADHWKVVDQTEEHQTVYGTTIEACEHAIHGSRHLHDGIEEVEEEPAVEIGRWCDRWWLRFERGYRICFKYCRKEKE